MPVSLGENPEEKNVEIGKYCCNKCSRKLFVAASCGIYYTLKWEALHRVWLCGIE